MIAEMLDLIVLYFLSIVFHEIGHIMVLKNYTGKRPSVRINKGKIIIGKPLDYKILNKKQKRTIYLIGVLFGLIVILYYSVLVSVYGLLLLPAYLYGCKNDIVLFFKTYEEVY